MGGGPELSTEDRLEGAGGVEIFLRSWPCAGEPRGVVVIAHGAGEHSGRYEHVAARLNEGGYEVYALDHRGHGRSGGPRALLDSIDAVVADMHSLLHLAAHEHPESPLVLLGHSMGGTVALECALRFQDHLAALVLSGPLAALDPAPAPLRVVARVLSKVAPRAGLIAVDSSQVSRDPEVVRAYREDPLVLHGKLPARTLVELVDTIDAFPQQVGSITLPTLIVYGTADGLAPPRGSEMLARQLGSEDLTVIPYEGLFHEVFNEPEGPKVLDDVVAWLHERV